MPDQPLWVFGYGSLMWNPGFPVAERRVARLDGWHRSFCMRSIHHRGTAEDPGLVLALDAAEGACCHGLAFRVESGAEQATIAYLRERELISSAYLETEQAIVLQGGAEVRALTFVIDTEHDQYCGGLPLEDQAAIIARAVGGRGPNTEYLFNTAQHLAELGIADAELNWLTTRVREINT
ncbi:gamma-glutamylcyclotransferase [Actibacterium sp. MT2.3-13A]|uniref:gamma-glutamylcyclotransferase n=1 Tax=Actibacterium sp. MT2.3-13A TaxID=2828332 RepID=UPI001BAB044D|nr:gamma-glutamylcyclotransferase [Actibacterium sp. MT2.3-13A]